MGPSPTHQLSAPSFQPVIEMSKAIIHNPVANDALHHGSLVCFLGGAGVIGLRRVAFYWDVSKSKNSKVDGETGNEIGNAIAVWPTAIALFIQSLLGNEHSLVVLPGILRFQCGGQHPPAPLGLDQVNMFVGDESIHIHTGKLRNFSVVHS